MAQNHQRNFPKGLRRITTGCQYCAVGCGYNAFLTPAPGPAVNLSDAPRFITPAMRPARDDTADPTMTGKVLYEGSPVDIAVAPDPRCDLNKGNHSVRGASQGQNLVAYRETTDAAGQTVFTPVGRSTAERLTTPWVRLDSGVWKEITWATLNEAMGALVATATDMRRAGDAIEVHNPRGLGVKIYEYQYLENTYAATKLFYSAIGTPNVAYHDRPSSAGSSPGLKDAGLRPHDFAYEDLQAADLIVMIGTNPYENQSVFFMQYCQGKEIVVIDPRRTATADYAARTGGMHIQPRRLGADSRLLYAIARRLIETWDEAHPGQPLPVQLPVGDTDDLAQNAGGSSEKKRQASRARSFAEFRAFLGVGEARNTTYRLEEAMAAADLDSEGKDALAQLMPKLLDPAREEQLKVAVLYEKGMIWGFNYHNTAALASLGVLLGAGSEPGRILGRVGGHQKGWAERRAPLKMFRHPAAGPDGPSDRYPTHNVTDRYTDEHLERTFPNGEARYIAPKHNLDHHVFGPLSAPSDPHEDLGPVTRLGPGGTQRQTRRIRLPNGLETDRDPDVSLLWIIGGNYLGQTNAAAWKRGSLHQRMKAGRPVNPRRPKTSDPDDIIAALSQRMRDGGIVCVQQEIFRNPTTDCCDIIIPAAGWGEDTFSRYNAQRRLKLYDRFQDAPLHRPNAEQRDVDPLEQSPRPDWQIIGDVAQAMAQHLGFPEGALGTAGSEEAFSWNSSGEVADEMAQASHRAGDHPNGLGLRALYEFGLAKGLGPDDGGVIHAVLGATAHDKNTNGFSEPLSAGYAVRRWIGATGDATAVGPVASEAVYTNGVACNGVFLPLSGGAPELTGHLSVRRAGPFYFVVAPWEEIEPAYLRINGLGDGAPPHDERRVLVTNGRFNHLWNNLFHHCRNDYVNDRYPEDMPGTVVEINPDWAQAQSPPIGNGDIVRLTPEAPPADLPAPGDTSDAERRFRAITYGFASLQDSVPAGMAFLMFSYPVREGRGAFNFNGYVNNITDGHADAVNPIAALKYGHAILTKVPADQSGFAEGRFVSPTRPGPLYEQRNRIGPSEYRGDRLDWEMRELIVRKGLPRANAHSLQDRPATFAEPDQLFTDLVHNTDDVREDFKRLAVDSDTMKWPLIGTPVLDQWHGVDQGIAREWTNRFPSPPEGGSNENGDTQGGNEMVGFARVQQILDESVGGPSGAAGFFHGAFWRNTTRDAFVALSIGNLPLVTLGDGAGSNLVKALKGEAPFGADQGVPNATIRRMPGGLPAVPDAQIAEIETWIDNGAPAEATEPAGDATIHEIALLPPLALARSVPRRHRWTITMSSSIPGAGSRTFGPRRRCNSTSAPVPSPPRAFRRTCASKTATVASSPLHPSSSFGHALARRPTWFR